MSEPEVQTAPEGVATESTEATTITEVTQQESTAQGPSAIEQRAMEMGWRPKEEFNGDEDDFIDAKEFVRRKPLFDKIEHQSKELKEIKKVLSSLQDHHVKVKETEFKRAVDYLKSQKKEALEVGDLDKVVELDEQLVDIKAAQKASEQVQKQPAQPQVHPDFTDWVGKNSWYAQDAELRRVADAIGLSYADENPEVPPKDVLRYVTQQVRAAFPKKFQNPEKTKPAAVDGGSSSAKPTKADTFHLTEDEERVMKQFVRAGILTKEQYIADVRAMRG
jgi:type II secretory pathway component PulM